ncbi:MAG: amidohydrolase family protein [Prolixibacteraceae bacterium]|nr:amidohydrolase family protein [Prolixibacteraceae bacterium]
MKTILIQHGTVLTFENGTVQPVSADLLIRNDRITQIGNKIHPPGDAEIIDANGMIVMPGLVDTHRHLWETAFKGIAANQTLMEYLNVVLGGIAPHFEPGDVYTGNLLGALEAINAGITTVFDWSHIMNSMEHAEAAIQALRDSGIRAKFGYGTPGTSVWEWFYESQLKHPLEAKIVRKKLLPSDDELVTMALAIRGPEYSTMEVTRHDILLGRKLDLQISMHIGGGTFGPKYNGVQKLYEADLLGADLNFAHANTLTENDFNLLSGHNCTVSVTPEVELQMGLGLPATGKAIRNGITCGLGVDVVTATSGNMFDQMKTALQAERAIQNEILYQKGEMPEKLTITDSDILKMATSGGAETLGLLHKTGTLETGKQADIILIDTRNISLSPSANPVSSVVLYAKENHVDTVLVAGKILKKHGKLIYPDLQDLLEKARESASRILNKKLVETV